MKICCPLCFHHCVLEEGQTGFCKARANLGGTVVPLNYGKITSIALDPIEKKPFRRFRPGSFVLSVGSFGCNMRCGFCQNYEISMAGPEMPNNIELSPEELVRKAEELKPKGNIGLAFTYNEPLVGYEFVRDCAELIHARGMLNVLVTNGIIEADPFRELLPLIDAANIDLKSFSHEWYRKLGGDLDTVKRSITMASKACHLEVTTLLVPGCNDSEEEIRALAEWLSALDRNIPLHLSRFFPRCQMLDRAPTPVEEICRLAGVAREFLTYVYKGNC